MSNPNEELKNEGAEPVDAAAATVLPLLFYRVKLLSSSETQIFSHPEPAIEAGEKVIIPGKYGRDLGRILGSVHGVSPSKAEDFSAVIRVATDKDLRKWEENREKEADAIRICREKVAARGLDMKLVAAHYLLDEPKVLFFFTAEARVDFRELVKDLVAIFRMRIELRQIGVRDESRILGGMAVCGRTYCCHGLTDKLRSVSIKMVKEQNLSLNSMKISGPCGRLLCCLSYEYDFYHEIKKSVPNEGARISCNGSDYKVAEVNVLSKTVRLVSSEGRTLMANFSNFKRREDQNNRWTLVDMKPVEE